MSGTGRLHAPADRGRAGPALRAASRRTAHRNVGGPCRDWLQDQDREIRNRKASQELQDTEAAE